MWYRPVAALMFIQLSHEHPPFWWANSVVVIVCVYQKSVEMHMKRSEMNYLDTLKGSDRERYSRKPQCLFGKSETDKENMLPRTRSILHYDHRSLRVRGV